MYRFKDVKQVEFVEFSMPFNGHLTADNRWVKTAAIMPWDRIEQEYLTKISQNAGREAYPARLAFGALYIKQSEGLSDRDCVQAILENPYMQYFVGFKEFITQPPFDPSMMVHFRRRFSVEFVAQVNEYICTGKWPEESRPVDRNDRDTGATGSGESPEGEADASDAGNKGTLIMDATVAPADIKYPTDIGLLNQCREHLESAISLLWAWVPHTSHKLPYSAKKARKSYLNVSKSKKWTAKLLHRGVGEQLDYIFRAMKRLQQLALQVPADKIDFPVWLWDRLSVIPKVYEQQKKMYDEGTHKCADRIVSLQQPHVRPINRGKRPNPTEFGQKLHLSVVNGYTYLEQTSWNNFNEATDLQATAQDYRRKFGAYPRRILADKIYQTRANRAFCKSHGIQLSGLPLGRRKLSCTDAVLAKQLHRDACDRNIVEGRAGNLKRNYGLNRIMAKTDEGAKTEAALDILAMNVARRLRAYFVFLLAYGRKSIGSPNFGGIFVKF